MIHKLTKSILLILAITVVAFSNQTKDESDYTIASNIEDIKGVSDKYDVKAGGIVNIDALFEPSEKPFFVVPSDIPNRGILFVDQEKTATSGHGGSCITECHNGDILAFYTVTWAENWQGHSCAGWSEYRRSSDGGRTWGEPVVIDYSKEIWDSEQVFAAQVFSINTAPNGTLIATVVRFANAKWRKQLPPVYLLSYDHGYTWSEAKEFDESATVYDISLTMDTSFVHDDEVFIVFMGGAQNGNPDGPYSLYVSSDNGESFSKRSLLPFDRRDYYSAAGVLDNGDIIVYSYPFRHRETDEKNMPYVTSSDGGRTWSEIKTTYFAKAIRNPQMSAKIGDYYFMTGRTGSLNRELIGDDPGPSNLVLYASNDGINWDEGTLLMSRSIVPGGGDCYTANEVVGKYDPSKPERLLIQSSISYSGARVNSHHWWVGVSQKLD